MVIDADAKVLRVQADAVKAEWKLLWLERIEDRVRAERVADRSFSLLGVERGTVIAATRDYRSLNLKDILRSYNVLDIERVVGPPPSQGGYTKFARTVLNKQSRIQKSRAEVRPEHCKKNVQVKKGGRGWLHK